MSRASSESTASGALGRRNGPGIQPMRSDQCSRAVRRPRIGPRTATHRLLRQCDLASVNVELALEFPWDTVVTAAGTLKLARAWTNGATLLVDAATGVR